MSPIVQSFQFASQEIDNFQPIEKMMHFTSSKDFYVVEAICRPKKDGKSTLCGTTNNHTRMIRLWTFYSIEDFRIRKDEIIAICKANNARAYFLPQKRNTYLVLKAMMGRVLDNLDNAQINFNRLISSCLCGCHDVVEAKDKRWVLDLDKDDMVEKWIEYNYGGKALRCREWTVEKVMDLVRGLVKETGKDPDSVCWIPTKNGWHIITPPFNLQKAHNQCRLMFEGEMEMPIKCEEFYLNPGDIGYQGAPGLDTKTRIESKRVNGWVHKDGMTLLYAPATKDRNQENV